MSQAVHSLYEDHGLAGILSQLLSGEWRSPETLPEAAALAHFGARAGGKCLTEMRNMRVDVALRGMDRRSASLERDIGPEHAGPILLDVSEALSYFK